MGIDVKIDANTKFMLEVAAAALCDADTCGGIYDEALDLARGALRYRAKKMREDADRAEESDHLHTPDKLRQWAADDEQAADRIEHLLELGREQVREIDGLSEPGEQEGAG